MKRTFLSLILLVSVFAVHAKTLVVYYSYTNNVHNIVTELTKQIDADVVRIELAEKGLDYAANNYAIGSALISAIRNSPNDAASYPAIDPVNVNLADYDCIIIGAPLWWSNMAAPLQTYLLHNGAAMAGKKIGLIVSSASSGISGVEGDAKRLIPEGDFFNPSLWIRSSQTSGATSMISQWLNTIRYDEVAKVENVPADQNIGKFTIFSVSGAMVAKDALSMKDLEKGVYIVNGKKICIN
ncbi:MAG: NAD(P)H-dependent oxidoreductase [Muribaculaceae bacterium]|nr:NAD(P)H-dependent oxidoreductase [Muribaculaceae bacterium]